MTPKIVSIFYQVEAIRAQNHLESSRDEPLTRLAQRITKKHGLPDGVQLFAEDSDEVARMDCDVGAIAKPAGAKIHLHRCARIAVAVAFGGRTLEHAFGPGSTLARVKQWATRELRMSDDDASEHVLQLAGTHDRPTPSTHLGSIVGHPHCRVAFDLVADERVQG